MFLQCRILNSFDLRSISILDWLAKGHSVRKRFLIIENGWIHSAWDWLKLRIRDVIHWIIQKQWLWLLVRITLLHLLWVVWISINHYLLLRYVWCFPLSHHYLFRMIPLFSAVAFILYDYSLPRSIVSEALIVRCWLSEVYVWWVFNGNLVIWFLLLLYEIYAFVRHFNRSVW